MDQVLLFQGAEGKLYKSSFLGSPCVIKERFKKRYRHPKLDDSITNSRLIAESRAMARSRRGGVDCPVIYLLDRTSLYMEFIDGITLKDFLDLFDTRITNKEICSSESPRNQCRIVETFGCSKEMILDLLPKLIGESIARLHNVGVIHGDITTSNIMLRRLDRDETSPISSDSIPFSVTLIDFGLSSTSSMAEDRAVDLFVMERALSSSHSHLTTFMRDILTSGYLPTVSRPDAVAQKLEEVRQRGRKRLMIG